MDVKMKKVGGQDWLSTLSIYKNIGLSAHHKLKQKAEKMKLQLSNIEGLGTALNLTNSIRILEAYRYTLKDEQLKSVNQLLEKLHQMKQPTKVKAKVISKSKKQPAKAAALKVSTPAVAATQPADKAGNQVAQPTLTSNTTKVNQSVDPSQPSGRVVNRSVAPTQPVGKEGNQLVQPTQPTLPSGTTKVNQSVDSSQPSGKPLKPRVEPEKQKPNDSSKKNTIKSPPKIRSQPKRNALVEVLLKLPDYIRTEYFIFMVLIFAIGIQVHHTAELYLRVSEDSNYWVGLITAYIFGMVSELTALLLTVHQGNRKMLKVFAIFSCWMNLLYYQVWEGFAWTPEYVTHLISEVTLSGFIAFVIFIYAHLFTLDIFEKEKAEE